MKRLNNYIYCASRYFSTSPTKKREDLKLALDELVNLKDNEIDIKYFYKKEEKKSEDVSDNEQNKEETYSEQDMPHENKTMKKHYDMIMEIIKEFFSKEKKIGLFLKLRAFTANKYKQK